MTDASEPAPQRTGRFPGLEPAFQRPPMRTWNLTVTEAFDVTPRMRRVRFTGRDLHEMHWKPGQDLVLSIPQPDGQTARRHYTIRHLTGSTLDIDFVLHHDSPAVRFAKDAQSSIALEAAGPRGRTQLKDEVTNHIFIGDETCLPGIFAMAEALRPHHKAHIVLEIADEKEKQELHARGNVTLTWLIRGQGTLLGALKQLAPLPDDTHAYIIGETAQVREQRHYLVERGFKREQITAEGYWRPGRVGGHDHV